MLKMLFRGAGKVLLRLGHGTAAGVSLRPCPTKAGCRGHHPFVAQFDRHSVGGMPIAKLLPQLHCVRRSEENSDLRT